MTNQYNSVLYTGVTSNLSARIYEHKMKISPGFTSKYNLDKLVFYEEQPDSLQAIAREKQIKSWSKRKKVNLITRQNPSWHDLYDSLF
jgi:putative endonuclease